MHSLLRRARQNGPLFEAFFFRGVAGQCSRAKFQKWRTFLPVGSCVLRSCSPMMVCRIILHEPDCTTPLRVPDESQRDKTGLVCLRELPSGFSGGCVHQPLCLRNSVMWAVWCFPCHS